MTISDSGQVRGTSETEGLLEGQLGRQAASGNYPISGTITAPDEKTSDFQTGSSSAEAGDYRFIVLSTDLTKVKGAKKGGGGGSVSNLFEIEDFS